MFEMCMSGENMMINDVDDMFQFSRSGEKCFHDAAHIVMG